MTRAWRFGPALAAAMLAGAGAAQVVGGLSARIEEHPWQVGLLISHARGGQNICGGALIADRWVLTAAHCFIGVEGAEQVRAKSGVERVLTQGDWSVVAAVNVHPGFDPETYGDDIALVTLARPAEGGESVRLIEPEADIADGAPLEVTGWGAVAEGGGFAETLQAGLTPLVSNERCNAPEAYAGRVDQGMLCAGLALGGVDACQGDSGGPLVWRGPDGPRLVGVVSWGEGCARPGRYGVYTRVAAYRDWIAQVMRDGG